MADLGDAVVGALADMEGRYVNRDWRRPGNVRELAAELAAQAGKPARAGNRLLAEALGVTPRTVQRWTTETAQQRRAVSSSHAAGLKDVAGHVAAEATAHKIARHGLDFELDAEVLDPSANGKRRQRAAHIDADADSMPQLVNAIATGDRETVGNAFSQAVFEQWQMLSYGREGGRGGRYGGGWDIGDVNTLRLG